MARRRKKQRDGSWLADLVSELLFEVLLRGIGRLIIAAFRFFTHWN